MKIEDRDWYSGCWKDHVREIYGTMICSDGVIYEGELLNGEWHGAVRKVAGNDSFEGQFERGKISGFGIYINQNGNSYKGKWYKDQQNGFGEEIWPDGAKYQGEYLDGRKNGQGKFTFIDGNIFEGEFLNNKINNYGEMTYKDGRKYKGNWKNGLKEGYGDFTWPDGRQYKGEYLLDKKEGQGVFYYGNGDIYSGSFANGLLHGDGKMYYKRGDITQKGIWREGEQLPTKQKNKEIFNEISKNLRKKSKLGSSKQEIQALVRKAFDEYCTDNSNFLERQEIKRFFDDHCAETGITPITNKQQDDIIDEVGKNGDGKLDYEELLNVFEPLLGSVD